MKPGECLFFLPGVLMLAAACYALGFMRVVNARRPAWLLFAAFALLALVRQVMAPVPVGGGSGYARAEQVADAVDAVVLLAGLVCLRVAFKVRLQAGRASAGEAARAEASAQLVNLTADFTKANEDLKATVDRLQNELRERTVAQEKLAQTHREMLTVSRQAGMSEVATGVLHNVGNVLNSVNVSATFVAERLAAFNIANLAMAAKMMREHAKDLGQFMTDDPKGRQLPEYLRQLAAHLSSEQFELLKEINFVKAKIEHIKEIVATQQRYGRVVGLAEKVKLTELVEDVLRIHATELAQHEVHIRREYAPDLPEIMLDKHKVLQIILNLLSNAKHACIESGGKDRQVAVAVANGDGRLRVAVHDNGVGIPAANLKQIFNHGFTTRKRGGHGFGLHSGALAAKELGGSLSAASEGPGQGATFTLELPLKHTRARSNHE